MKEKHWFKFKGSAVISDKIYNEYQETVKKLDNEEIDFQEFDDEMVRFFGLTLDSIDVESAIHDWEIV